MCYYHLMNRVSGEPGYFPFKDVEKEKFFTLALKLARFYSLEILSVVVMSNHYHIVCAAPADAPSREEVVKHWQAFHGKLRGDTLEPNWDSEDVVRKFAIRMRDISCFIKDLQQRFTCWFNRTRPTRRRGSLWADRFKDTILEKDTALWDCLVYVEMNPVRAGLVESPEDYRFCTWGRMGGSGKHPFQKQLCQHLRDFLGEKAKHWSQRRILAELSAEMLRIAASERGENAEATRKKADALRNGREKFLVTARRRVRYWTDGAVIGSETFVREIGAVLFDAERAEQKRLSQSRPAESETSLFAYRRLNQTT
jgi:REP element-mobilizing transposase RayT